MAWVVDSNLLFDVALDDPAFRHASMELLRKRRGRGLVACPVTVVKLAPPFDGDVVAVRGSLNALGVKVTNHGSDATRLQHASHGRSTSRSVVPAPLPNVPWRTC